VAKTCKTFFIYETERSHRDLIKLCRLVRTRFNDRSLELFSHQATRHTTVVRCRS